MWSYERYYRENFMYFLLFMFAFFLIYNNIRTLIHLDERITI